jgi:hypothetical protein
LSKRLFCSNVVGTNGFFSKKNRFQEYVSEVETLPAMAKLSKILRAKPSSKLGLVKKPDGSLCTSTEESLATIEGVIRIDLHPGTLTSPSGGSSGYPAS